MIGLEHYLAVAATLFIIGVFGLFLNRKNVIILLMSIELMLLAVNINLVAFSSFLGDLVGQVFTLFVLTVAAAEAAIGLARPIAASSAATVDTNKVKNCPTRSPKKVTHAVNCDLTASSTKHHEHQQNINVLRVT